MEKHQFIATKDGKTDLVEIQGFSEASAAEDLRGQGYTDVHVPTYAEGIAMLPVLSSQLDSVGHDPATNTMAIRFKPGKQAAAQGQQGSLYHYQNVTPEKYAEGRAAESFNSWFIANVKKNPDAHPYEKITEAV